MATRVSAAEMAPAVAAPAVASKGEDPAGPSRPPPGPAGLWGGLWKLSHTVCGRFRGSVNHVMPRLPDISGLEDDFALW